MKFPAKVVRGYMITIPANIRNFDDIKVGDEVVVEVVKKDSIEHNKEKFDSHFRRGD